MGTGLDNGREVGLVILAGGFVYVTSQGPCLGVGSRGVEGRQQGQRHPPVWPPASHFFPAPLADEHQRGTMALEAAVKGQNSLHQLVWSVSITIITNRLITDFPTNSN